VSLQNSHFEISLFVEDIVVVIVAGVFAAFEFAGLGVYQVQTVVQRHHACGEQ
jgi:hypothetical protein